MGRLTIFEFEEGFNVFVFSFQVMDDKRKVWKKRIWNLDCSLMVLNEYFPDFTLDHYNFSIVPFRIHLHGIPRNLMFVETTTKLANSIGKVIEMERMSQQEPLTLN